MGVDAHVVDVEAHIAPGLPATAITGLGDTAIKEARERMRAAFSSTGYDWPQARITIGLSPAALPKHGSTLDLAMALAVLAAARKLPPEELHGTLVLGELGLDGRVRRARGVLPVVIAAARNGFRRVLVPMANAREAELVDGVTVLPVASLGHCLRLLGVDCEAGVDTGDVTPHPAPAQRLLDLADVRGQPAGDRDRLDVVGENVEVPPRKSVVRVRDLESLWPNSVIIHKAAFFHLEHLASPFGLIRAGLSGHNPKPVHGNVLISSPFSRGISMFLA